MKTLANTTMKKAAIIIAFVCAGLQVNAQKSADNLSILVNEKVKFVESIVATIEHMVADISVDASRTNIVLEEPMYVEDWMVDASGWEAVANAEMVLENELPIEPWMLDFDKQFNNGEITEPELELEDWMCSSEHWNR